MNKRKPGRQNGCKEEMKMKYEMVQEAMVSWAPISQSQRVKRGRGLCSAGGAGQLNSFYLCSKMVQDGQAVVMGIN
jgi:hypothetical protein